MVTTATAVVEKSREKNESFLLKNFFQLLLISSLILFVIFVLLFRDPATSSYCNSLQLITSISTSTSTSSSHSHSRDNDDESSVSVPTNIRHLAFGLQGSEKTLHFRKGYLEAWWRPNVTRGYVYLENPPSGDLLPWSPNSPPYRVNDDLSQLISEIRPIVPQMPRMVHGILELFREENQGLRWLIIGDDDTMFFVDNLVDVLSQYDHTKYYYIGAPSDLIVANLWYSFNMGFGGGGIILSYPLAKALVTDMNRCLRTYSNLSADLMTMACLADIGVNLTPHKGLHQTDLRGDYSGYLSSHPKELVLSLHHWDDLDPIFPSMTRSGSAQHLMKAGNVDQSRLFQQTICHHRKTNWTFSVAWGYSAHIYENVMSRSWLMMPIETFRGRMEQKEKPTFMFNTRWPFGNPCEAPHVFFFQSIEKTTSSNGAGGRNEEIVTVYTRQWPRNLAACSASGNHSAEFVTTIHVFSLPTKRPQVDRAECCDVVRVEAGTGKAQVKLRECKVDEIIT